MSPLLADLITGGSAVVPLPCGHSVGLSAAEIRAAWAVQRQCDCGRWYSLAPVPDHVLSIIDSEERNPPGKLLVFVLPPPDRT